MAAGDLAAAHGLSRREGWPHRPEDWRFLFALGSGLVAETDQGVVGTAMWWPYGLDAAALGLVIVSPDCRGQGIGRRLIQMVLDRTGDRAVLLNATAAAQPLYRRLGFQPIGEIRQHQGAGFSPPALPLGAGERIRPIGRDDGPALAALDRAATGLARAALITALLAGGEGVALDRDGSPAGFALFRRFGRGYVVGPVAAPSIDIAKALISHWIGSRAGMFIRIDTPGDSGLSGWLDDLGLAAAAPVQTMARGLPPVRDPAMRLFAIASQASG